MFGRVERLVPETRGRVGKAISPHARPQAPSAWGSACEDHQRGGRGQSL